MKRFTKILALVCVISFLSCNEDEEPSSGENDADVVYTQAYVINYGASVPGEGFDHEGFNLDLVLYTSDIQVDINADQTTGIGNGAYFEMFSSEEDGYPSGNYSYSDTEPYPVGSFDYGELCEDCDFSSSDFDAFTIEITNGTVTIDRSGDTYTISFTVTDETGKTTTGYFNGSITYIDDSNGSKTSVPTFFKKRRKS